MESRFNLIDESWVPASGGERVSLLRVFTDPRIRWLGGTPLQKASVLKLLLAIAQAAATQPDEEALLALGSAGLAAACKDYLARWHERFWLYGDRPFLQMPAVAAAGAVPCAELLPGVSGGNTVLLRQDQAAPELDDADLALLLVTTMLFAFSGKKVDQSVVLTPGYVKKTSARPGPALGKSGSLHSYVLGETLQQTVWLNVLTAEEIERCAKFPAGVGAPPWEQMPAGENDPVAQALRDSLMGRLAPVSRFCLLAADSVHMSEGVQDRPKDVKAVTGIAECDPALTVKWAGKPVALRANPAQRPWRELPALLSFLGRESAGMACQQLGVAVRRVAAVAKNAGGVGVRFGLWSGGLSVQTTAGEQTVSGFAGGDYVESTIELDTSWVNAGWFALLSAEITALGKAGFVLRKCIGAYYQRLGGAQPGAQTKKKAKSLGSVLASQAETEFWGLCELHLAALFEACGTDRDRHVERLALRKEFAADACRLFDRACPSETARQIVAWVASKPNLYHYVFAGEKDARHRR